MTAAIKEKYNGDYNIVYDEFIKLLSYSPFSIFVSFLLCISALVISFNKMELFDFQTFAWMNFLSVMFFTAYDLFLVSPYLDKMDQYLYAIVEPSCYLDMPNNNLSPVPLVLLMIVGALFVSLPDFYLIFAAILVFTFFFVQKYCFDRIIIYLNHMRLYAQARVSHLNK